MACPAFDVTVSDVKKALDKVKKAISGKGSLSGDETGGDFTFSDDGGFMIGKYTIKGSYVVKGTKITITNNITAESPKLVTCDRVADKMKEWLK